MGSKVSIILINFNGLSFTQKCIRSLEKTDYKNKEIIVIDNGSDNGESLALKKMKGIRFFPVSKNIGFAAGVNLGIKHSTGDYILVLNNDTEVEPDFLSILMKKLKSDKSIGAVVPNILDKNSKGKFVELPPGTLTLTGAAVRIPDTENIVEEKFWPSGCCFLYKKERRMPFDPAYFIYHEDVYFGWRKRLRGEKIVTVPAAKIFHERGAVTKTNPELKKFFHYLAERNRLINILIFYNKKNLIKVTPLVLTSILLRNIRDTTAIMPSLRAYSWLLLHIPSILKKRRRVQKERIVGDNKILRYLSYKIVDDSEYSLAYSIINNFARIYCTLLRIKTREFYLETSLTQNK